MVTFSFLPFVACREQNHVLILPNENIREKASENKIQLYLHVEENKTTSMTKSLTGKKNDK